MTELDVLGLFYDEMVAQSITREALFLTLEDDAALQLSEKLGVPVSVEELQKVADTCIANEWLERTTADVYYKYLSVTEAGLQVILASRYL